MAKAGAGKKKMLMKSMVVCVGMHASGDVMIGQHGRSVHEAIPHICGDFDFSLSSSPSYN